jgi:nucleoside-diphosphate-sugar epimerase
LNKVVNRLLVTGANGFVGQALCGEAMRRGLHVKGAVRSACKLPDGVEQTITGLIDRGTSWIEALHGVDVVIHLAARVHVMKDAATDPLSEFLETNLHGTENLARQASHAGVRRLVYVSSIKVNGESTFSPNLSHTNVGEERDVFTESDKPDPQDPYAISKWQAEQALWRIAQETNLEVVIVRPPLVYGPGVKGNFISLLTAIDRGIPLPLARINNARSLVYVDNLVDALITCATHPAAAGQTYLVSDGEDVSTALLVEKIAQALGHSNHSFYFPPGLLQAAATLLGRAKQAERLLGSLRVNSQKICSELNWTPPYSLEHGLRATTDWYRTPRNGYNRTTS